MKRSLTLVRDALLGRPLPDTPSGQMSANLAAQCPMLEAAILRSFSDRQWAALREWCSQNGLLWNGEDIAAPVGLLPGIAKAVAQ